MKTDILQELDTITSWLEDNNYTKEAQVANKIFVKLAGIPDDIKQYNNSGGNPEYAVDIPTGESEERIMNVILSASEQINQLKSAGLDPEGQEYADKLWGIISFTEKGIQEAETGSDFVTISYPINGEEIVYRLESGEDANKLIEEMNYGAEETYDEDNFSGPDPREYNSD